MNDLVLIEYEDWSALYNKGQLVYEGHTGDVRLHVVDLLIERHEATPEQEATIYNEGTAPVELP